MNWQDIFTFHRVVDSGLSFLQGLDQESVLRSLENGGEFCSKRESSSIVIIQVLKKKMNNL